MKKYRESLLKALKNPEEAAAYLNAVLEEGDETMLLVALKNVVEAFGGFSKLAKSAHLNRPNLYRIFSKKGNPEVHTLSEILDKLGLRISIAVKSDTPLRRAA